MTRYAIVAVVVLAGCAGSAAAPTTTTVVPGTTDLSRALAPNLCDTPMHVDIKPIGGSFKVPECEGWNGTIVYPRPTGPFHFEWSVRSSVTNNFGVPAPPSGSAIFYMLIINKAMHTPTFTNGGVMNTILNPTLSPKHFYSLVVYNFESDNQCRRPPPSGCPPWFANIGRPAPGTHSITFQSPLNGAAFNFSKDPVWQFVQH
jgi:hypothetical protein